MEFVFEIINSLELEKQTFEKKKKRNGHKREANVSHKALLGDFVT